MRGGDADRDADIRSTWDANAGAWTSAVREGRIASRSAGTDEAIFRTIARLRPGRVADVGCGEGWLARRLALERGCEVHGFDGSERLIAEARAAHPNGAYAVLTYEDLVERPEALRGPYDVVVCNFALFGENVASILAALRPSLKEGGRLLIQTLHPWTACGEAAYADGWRQETFAAMGSGDWRPMPWYFRTLETWVGEIRAAGLVLDECREPVEARTGKLLSLILSCAAKP